MRRLLVCLVAIGCEGPAGPAGPAGENGGDGATGGSGAPGDPGTSPWLTAPGVDVKVTGLSFDAQGATVALALTDGSGAPLDASGKLTAGAVSLGFVLAQLSEQPDGSPGPYTAYTTAPQTSPITGATVVQPTTESSGALTPIDVTQGTYTYRVAAPLTGLAATSTQTVGVLALRNGAIARTTFSARPDGGAPIARELVTPGACNACHRALSAHGGRWTEPAQCVLCHQPQNRDPDTGNALDFRVMVHKIHRGAQLPSVVAGAPYQIIGYAQRVHDFSSVEFPQEINHCTACHTGAQADRWKTAPAKQTCTSCHDTTSFDSPVPAGMVLHSGGTQPDNAPCNVCHPATGSLAGIADKHLTALLSPAAPQLALAIVQITGTAPGSAPVLTFTATLNGAPADLLGKPLNGLTATIAGPTTDYATEWQARIQGTGAIGALTVVDASTGTYRYAFPASAAIPAGATGSYTVGLEGYTQPTSSDPRYAAVNPLLTFAVTDATPQPRRAIVARGNCNQCHRDLSAHGGARKDPAYCVMCHNPSAYDSAGAPRFQGSSNVLAEALDFRRFIHKVHAGDHLSRPYVLGGFPLPSTANPGGTQVAFTGLRYPAPLTSCTACHAGATWQLPMTASPAYAPTTSARMTCGESVVSTTSYCDNPFWTVASTSAIGPEASVCTSCHDSEDTAAHAAINTTPAGQESCATCHGPGKAYDVATLHATP